MNYYYIQEYLHLFSDIIRCTDFRSGVILDWGECLSCSSKSIATIDTTTYGEFINRIFALRINLFIEMFLNNCLTKYKYNQCHGIDNTFLICKWIPMKSVGTNSLLFSTCPKKVFKPRESVKCDTLDTWYSLTTKLHF